MPPSAYLELRNRLAEIHDLDRARAVLFWDERTMMPSSGAAARAEQLATLVRVRHEKLISSEIGRLLDELRPWADDLSYESDEASLVRVTRRDYEKRRRVPVELIAEIARATSHAEHAWRDAQARSDFNHFLPYLEKNVELKLTYAGCFDEAAHVYDPLLDDYEPGMATAEMGRLLGELKSELLPLVARVVEQSDAVDDGCLYGHFPVERQQTLIREIVAALPLEQGAWRLDPTVHPFASAPSRSDIRLTTRYDERYLGAALFAALHEAGHGLYESGIAAELDRTPLGRPTSLGLHESQSRMWENVVGRSRAFWQHFYPKVAAAFPEQFDSVDGEDFYRAVNKVERSLIRMEADELTYDLHIALRFELELEILEGKLSLPDLPEVWNARTKRYLGIDVPDERRGVLQDVHWAAGSFGYFPTYSLGNIIAGQLWEAALEAMPDLDEQLARGELGPLREWLRERVHRHGRKFTSQETVERVVGGPIDVGPYVRYLKEKLGRLYPLS